MSSEEDWRIKCINCDKRGVPLHICVVCDEFLYCDDCSVKCDCEKGPIHYLCENGYHYCRFECCPKNVCNNCEIPVFQGTAMDVDDPSRWGGDVWCKDHRPPVSPQMRDLVLDSLGVTLEEVEHVRAEKRARKE